MFFCLFVVFLSLLHSIKYHIQTCGASEYTVFGSVSVKIINSANSFGYLFCLKLSGKLFLSQHRGCSGKMWAKTNYHDRKVLESCLVSGECLLLPPWPLRHFTPFQVEKKTLPSFHSLSYIVHGPGTSCITWNKLLLCNHFALIVVYHTSWEGSCPSRDYRLPCGWTGWSTHWYQSCLRIKELQVHESRPRVGKFVSRQSQEVEAMKIKAV